MRLTVFWERLHGRFGVAYGDTIARDLVIESLGGRCVVDALAAGLDPAEVWHAVCEAAGVPVEERH